LKRALERLGHHVLAAAGAKSGLALYADGDDRIDLLITDVRLPGMDGLSLARELRRRDPTIAILVISGDLEGGPPGEFPELAKPFTFATLAGRIVEVLEAASGGSPARIRLGG
jgi:two-component system, cell cycle sensor histidine kinase and response regulator CckA